MSGFTTTGATVIAGLDGFPRAILLWRSLTQWLGGLGILVLFVALLSSLGVASKALFQHESSAKRGASAVQARMQDLAVRLWQIYVGLSIVCFLGLLWLGLDPFESVCHALTAISTGGFSLHDESIGAYDNAAVELWLVLFMVLGGMSFILYMRLLRREWARWKAEEEAKFYLGLMLVVTAVIAMDLVLVENKHTLSTAIRESLFHVVSIMTTTGYTTADYGGWPPLSQLMFLLLMAIGGCAGSTAGGIKISRWILFFKTVGYEITRAFRPNRVVSLRLNGGVVDESLRTQVAFFIALAGVTVALGTVAVSLFEPTLDIDSCLSAVVACLFNIGPGLGTVGPTQNFASMGGGALGILSLLMLLGRLEFFAVIVLFVPTLWKKY
jgi:trk system potassium uptake protein TrkH